MNEKQEYPIIKECLQSAPIALDKKYDPAWLQGKTIVITGGASGFGAAFCKHWVKNGAHVVIGDIAIEDGNSVVRDIQKENPEAKVAFFPCNVVEWQSQVDFFKEAVKFSPHGGIDMVVANAGIAGIDKFEDPVKLHADEPAKPNLMTVNVNLIGVLYTTHLGLFWLKKNPGSTTCNPNADPALNQRDRHILLLGSMASLGPLPTQALYTAAKHAVLGMYRSLRATAFIHGIRVNLLCPYFIETPILPGPARALLAGGAMGKPEDVLDAATRFAADSSIIGRSLYIGPRMSIIAKDDGSFELSKDGSEEGAVTRAIWEPFAHDLEDSELFGRRFVKLLNAFTRLRGIAGFVYDLIWALIYTIKAGPSSLLGRKLRKQTPPPRKP